MCRLKSLWTGLCITGVKMAKPTRLILCMSRG
jgi:hypothetical protein